MQNTDNTSKPIENPNMQNTDKAVMDSRKVASVEYNLNDCGCYVDGAHGIYAPGRIVAFAVSHGANIDTESDIETLWDAETEATDYMNDKFAVEGAFWDRNENGDWGLWTNEAI